MAHSGHGFHSKDVASRGPEEVEHRSVVRGRRIRHVDDYLRTLERPLEALARVCVDTGLGRRRDRVVPRLAQLRDSFDPMSPVPPITTMFIVVPFPRSSSPHVLTLARARCLPAIRR